jgi:uncharacterized protein (DUF302 family)
MTESGPALQGSVNPVVLGFLIGVILTLIAIRIFASQVMIRRDTIALSRDRAVGAVLDAAAARGWSVPTVHHLSRSPAGTGTEGPEATVVELCRPDYAAGLLQSDDARAVIAMMPCRVAVYETSGGRVFISRMNVAFMGWLFGGRARMVMARAGHASEEIVACLRGRWGG